MKNGLILIITLLFLVLTTFAQPNSGSLRGQVKDSTAAVIVGATVTIIDGKRVEKTAQTDKSGSFSFENLPVGKYTVRAENAGFAAYENPTVNVAASRNSPLDITLKIESIETEVQVGDENRLSLSPDNNASAIVLKQEDIEALPDDPDDLAEALQALAGPSAGPNGGGIYIDGFSGGSLPPRDTIREIRINSNPFSSEYDRLGYGRIEILTKPGTDKFRGEFEMEFEDESLNSRNPFLGNRPSFQRREIEAQIGGPIIKKRVSFFLNFEREDTDNNAFINALVLDSNLNPLGLQSSAPAPSADTEFDGRIDFQINDKNTFIGRYAIEKGNRENAGLGGFNLLSRAYQTQDREQSIRLTETAVLSPKIINEARFQYIRRRNSEEGSDNSPTIEVLDAFTGGGANIGQAFSNEDFYEFQNYTSFIFDRLSFKVGGLLRHIKLLDSSPNNFAGTFTFTSLDQYRATLLENAIPTQFSIAGGDPQAGMSQTDYGIFAQNDWRVNPEFTLSFGLRYENQTNISSRNNIAPRIGFAYAPRFGGKDAKTVFRGGFGIFYDRFSENLSLQAVRYNGINQQRFIVEDPAILDNIIYTQNGISNIPTAAALIGFAQPQTTRIVSPGLQSPYTAQFAFSVEQQLPYNTTFSATFLNAQSRRLLRSRNINAPMGGVRPIPGQGNIFQYESTGKFSQNQLILNLRTRFSKFSIFGNYSINDAKSDTDGAGTFPIDQFDLSGEYGRSMLDATHRFVMGGSYDAPWGFRIRPFIVFRSGSPFNITNGIDSNGDTLFTERPTFAQLFARCGELGLTNSFCTSAGVSDLNQTIPRNYGTSPEFLIVNLRASKEFEFGSRSGGGEPGGGDRRRRGGRGGSPFGNSGGGGNDNSGGDKESPLFTVEFTISARNVFNRTNLNTPVGNLRSSLFGQSLSTAGGFGRGGGGNSNGGNRRLELEVQFSF